jgi:hypothetical protein
MPNYGVALQSDPLAELAKAWWSHEIFSFTTYGLSARTDPLYLSGVWTALDDTWDCYNGDQPEQINQGELAEMWLLHHRLVSLEWQDGQYLVTVEPTDAGLQLVQFSPARKRPGIALKHYHHYGPGPGGDVRRLVGLGSAKTPMHNNPPG